MKQINKMILVLIMVVSILIPTFSGALIAYAEDPFASIGAEISIAKMPTEGTIGTVLNIPKGISTDGAVITKIYGPKGTLLFDSSVDSLPDGVGNTYAYNPLKAGNYKVIYSVISNDETIMASTTSNEYNINVTGSNPIFDFDNNSSIILPSTTNYDYQIIVPYPIVYDSNGNVVDLADVASNITITGKKPDVSAITFGTTNINGVNYLTFTPQEVDGEGIYTINYLYSDVVTGLKANSSFEMVVEAGFNPENIILDYVLDGSMPESGVLGKEIILPKPITRDENTGNALIKTYIDVTVEFINPNGDNIPYDVQDFKFTPMHEGDYEVTYSIADFFKIANSERFGDYSYTISNVEDNESPEVMPVENYNISTDIDNEFYDFKNVEYLIPSNVAVGDTVNFPAIHATDNFDLSSDLTYKRTIVNANNTITDLDHATENLYDYDETVPYTFTSEGIYRVKYYATDTHGNQKVITYKLEVIDGFIDNEAPRITLESMPGYVETGDVIKFLKPVAVDYVSTESTDTVDERVEVNVYYYLGDNIANKVEILEDQDDSDYLSFIVPENMVESYLHILVEATDDGKNNSSGTNTATKVRKLNIMDTNDGVIPSFVGSEPIINAVDQDQTVEIPTIKITDNNPTFMSVMAQVKNPNGKTVNVTGLQIAYESDTLIAGDADGIVISGGTYTATIAGNYKITYTATDVAGNIFIKSYVQYVNDTRAPSFNLDSLPLNLEVGEAVILPTPIVMDNGVEIVNEAQTSIVFIDSPAYNLVLASYEFTPLEEGIYSFKYIAEDEFGNTSESAIYTVTVVDSINPIITLDEGMPFPLTAPLTRENDTDPYNDIEIPGFIAYDQFNGIEEFSVEVKNPSGEIILDAKNAEGINGSNNNYKFTPTKDGSYQVTYSAIDFAGNEATEVKIVKVGDNAAPTIIVGNTTINKPGNKKVGDTISLDLSSVTVEDAKDGAISLNDLTLTGESKFVVKLTAPNGSTNEFTNDNYTFELEEAGDYTLTYLARDEAGNEKVETIVFQVAADEKDPVVITETWGIILIILSLIILAGVVVYFVRSREIIED